MVNLGSVSVSPCIGKWPSIREIPFGETSVIYLTAILGIDGLEDSLLLFVDPCSRHYCLKELSWTDREGDRN